MEDLELKVARMDTDIIVLERSITSLLNVVEIINERINILNEKVDMKMDKPNLLHGKN